MLCFGVFFFFFKQKTAYEMRISDWSSDVCSSDLPEVLGEAGPSFDLRQHVGDTRGRQHTVAGKRQMPSFVVPGIIVLQFLGEAQSLASEQGSITSGQILGDVAQGFVELRGALIEPCVWITEREHRLQRCAT